jgi:hypothetical protein
LIGLFPLESCNFDPQHCLLACQDCKVKLVDEFGQHISVKKLLSKGLSHYEFSDAIESIGAYKAPHFFVIFNEVSKGTRGKKVCIAGIGNLAGPIICELLYQVAIAL